MNKKVEIAIDAFLLLAVCAGTVLFAVISFKACYHVV